MKVIYLKENKGHSAGEITELPQAKAEMLISQGVVRQASTRDYLVQPSYGFKAITRAFRKKLN